MPGPTQIPLSEVVLDESAVGLRVDAAAVEAFGIPARARARKMLKRGEVLLNGAAVETSRFVKVGDRLTLLAPAAPTVVYERDLEVAYIDDDLAVILKPPGIPVRDGRLRTVENALSHVLKVSPAPDGLPRPRAVHRLDVRTAGLLIVARTAGADVALGRAFAERRIRKRYRAIVRGRLEGAGLIERPIGGRAASTRWEAVLHHRSLHCEWITTLDLFPKTGRTHQLRIHCAKLGHPILGDDLHTDDGPVLRGTGLYLFASGLEFAHPRTGEPIRVDVPEPQKYVTYRNREQRRWEAFGAHQ
jgi:tRNA pseudouridine65 synthase/23S rRNA pseudouridine1911/1915/1917 synthase